MRYNRAVYIGRFQPFHIGHRSAINKCLEIAEDVVVLVGSANSPRTPDNPFTYDERRQMIQDEFGGRVSVFPLRDFKYDDTRWLQEVQRQSNRQKRYEVTLELQLHGIKTAIVGLDKDDSTYYLRMFPRWTFVSHDRDPLISATAIRRIYFRGESTKLIQGAVPHSTFNFLTDFVKTKEYEDICSEVKFLSDYKAKYSHLPFPPTHLTVDAVVIQSGHVLLVKRGRHPGKGLWALPGGFLGQGETMYESALRELYEETNIKVQQKIMQDRCIKDEIFDHPSRDARGRTVTRAYVFKLHDEEKLPKVKGGDDAEEARWFSLDEFEKMEPVIYSDHWHIVKSLT
jgi:bifunctional NMN adenylyltransferase/nudix hydrolase